MSSHGFRYLFFHNAGQPTETRPALRLIGRPWSDDAIAVRAARRGVQGMLGWHRIKHRRPAVHGGEPSFCRESELQI